MNERDRYLEKEKFCINHKELSEFIKEKFDKLKYRKKENLEYLTR
jgi:hypothetical protein